LYVYYPQYSGVHGHCGINNVFALSGDRTEIKMYCRYFENVLNQEKIR